MFDVICRVTSYCFWFSYLILHQQNIERLKELYFAQTLYMPLTNYDTIKYRQEVSNWPPEDQLAW